jgi:hypothetical protein
MNKKIIRLPKHNLIKMQYVVQNGNQDPKLFYKDELGNPIPELHNQYLKKVLKKDHSYSYIIDTSSIIIPIQYKKDDENKFIEVNSNIFTNIFKQTTEYSFKDAPLKYGIEKTIYRILQALEENNVEYYLPDEESIKCFINENNVEVKYLEQDEYRKYCEEQGFDVDELLNNIKTVTSKSLSLT